MFVLTTILLFQSYRPLFVALLLLKQHALLLKDVTLARNGPTQVSGPSDCVLAGYGYAGESQHSERHSVSRSDVVRPRYSVFDHKYIAPRRGFWSQLVATYINRHLFGINVNNF